MNNSDTLICINQVIKYCCICVIILVFYYLVFCHVQLIYYSSSYHNFYFNVILIKHKITIYYVISNLLSTMNQTVDQV